MTDKPAHRLPSIPGKKQRQRQFKLVQIMQEQPDRYLKFLGWLKMGCTVAASAEAIGVSGSAAHRVIQEGRKKDASAACRKVSRDVFKAIGGARVLTEAEVRQCDPKYWLTNGPGRILDNAWSQDAADDSDKEKQGNAALSQTDIIKGLIELHRAGISIDELIADGRIHSLAPNTSQDSKDHNNAIGIAGYMHTGAADALSHQSSTHPDHPTSDAGRGVYGESSLGTSVQSSQGTSVSDPLPNSSTTQMGTGHLGTNPPLIPGNIEAPEDRKRRRSGLVENPYVDKVTGLPLGDYPAPVIRKEKPTPRRVVIEEKDLVAEVLGGNVLESNINEELHNMVDDICNPPQPNPLQSSESSTDCTYHSTDDTKLPRGTLQDLIQGKIERKRIRDMEDEELANLEDSLPDGLRKFLLGE